jgi:MFS family permease
MQNGSPVSLTAYWRLLQSNQNFRLLWLSQLISEIGDWLYMVAVYSLLLDLTGSARIVAFAFVLQVLPQCFTAPVAGVLNDRLSRRKVMMFTDWCRAFIVFAMLFTQTRQTIPLLYVLLFLETVCWAIFEPGRTAVIPNITNASEVLVANSMSSLTWSFTLAVGSAIGGVIAALLGRPTLFALNALSVTASALLIRRMKFHEPHAADLPALKPKDLVDFSPIAEGVRYVSRDKRMLATMFVKAGVGILGTNWVILPLLGEKIFPLAIPSGGMLAMSILMGSRGVGSLLGPIIANYFTGTDQRKFRIGILCGFVIGALGYALLGTAGALWTACLAVIIAHGGSSVSWVFSTTILQMSTDDKFRGRVFAAEAAFSMLTISIVSYSAGILADAGVRVRTLASGTGLLILVPVILWTLALRLWSEPARSLPAHSAAPGATPSDP